jgi:hypothetical protein
MKIKKIHSIQWGDVEMSVVRLIADTDTGDSEEIGTPYGPESIIWEDIQEFPADQIQAFQPESAQ